jgi:hypothetical protein
MARFSLRLILILGPALPGLGGVPCHAQATRVLVGTATEALSGTPIRKAAVCTRLPTGPASFLGRCAAVGVDGTYRLDSLPVGSVEVTLSCAAIRGFGKRLVTDTLLPGQPGEQSHDWVASTVGCDLRPVREVAGTFRGHYTPGFESSEFIPCPSDAWFLPGDSLDTYPYDARRAWATWPRDRRMNSFTAWPDVPADSWGNPRYYVRWRGTVVGPGQYGHMGVSPFEFRLDSILEVRPPAKDDCQ